MSVPIADLLNRLHKVSRVGEGKWKACCPAHDDRSPSLAIRLTDENMILMHCFAGCAVLDVIYAIGMNLDDLMPDNMEKRDKPRTLHGKAKELQFETRLISLAIIDANNGKVQTEEERARMNLALSRIVTLSDSLVGEPR